MPATPKPQERVTGRVRTAKVQDFRRDVAELAPEVEVRVLVPGETLRLSSLCYESREFQGAQKEG